MAKTVEGCSAGDQLQNDPNSNAEEDGLRFWDNLQNEVWAFITTQIKHILTLNGLDNPVSFRKVSKEIIMDLENFTKTVMPNLLEEG